MTGLHHSSQSQRQSPFVINMKLLSPACSEYSSKCFIQAKLQILLLLLSVIETECVPQIRVLQSKIPNYTIDPVQTWVWGSIGGGFVFQASQTFGKNPVILHEIKLKYIKHEYHTLTRDLSAKISKDTAFRFWYV